MLKPARRCLPLLLLGMLLIPPDTAVADPPVIADLPTVFCFRITDMERVAGDAEEDRFKFSFEVLNWTSAQAHGLRFSLNTATSSGVEIVSAGIDANGRGGTTATSSVDIGGASFDTTPIHSGRGRGDLPGLLNDWNTSEQTSSNIQWDALPTLASPLGGTAIPNRDLILANIESPNYALTKIPGLGVDALGDSAIDGGPTPYSIAPGGGQPDPDGSGNVLDGFVVEVDGWGVGDTLSANWQLLTTDSVFLADVASENFIGGAGELNPILSFFGQGGPNAFGFGTLTLDRLELGQTSGDSQFVGNSGTNQSPFLFYDDVFDIPNPATFAGEIGAGQTATFMNPADNTFNLTVNAIAVPEPSAFCLLAFAGLVAVRRRRA